MIVKVIRAFRERLQDMRLYNIGETYQVDDIGRAEYLAGQGFLAVESDEEEPVSAEEPKPEPRPPESMDSIKLTFDEFSKLPAAGQKKILSDLGIMGDYSNTEKREKLYKEYLGGGDLNGHSDD